VPPRMIARRAIEVVDTGREKKSRAAAEEGRRLHFRAASSSPPSRDSASLAPRGETPTAAAFSVAPAEAGVSIPFHE
ncbi:MAG: hypothetical protein K0U78_20810, partial [Actinomycetia bacterium]|nr:hypothetical protein [Actinomycetes bacterium]